jgi:hypothetical protein
MTTTPPTADACRCQFVHSPATHDWLIGFEEWSPLRAATVAAGIIGDEDIHTIATPADVAGDGTEEMDFSEAGTFERFVSHHNWERPAEMAEMAHAVTWAAEQAHAGRGARRRVPA